MKKEVRAEVEDRDGYCRFVRFRSVPFGECDGPSEWNHLLRRSATQGMEPEERHNSTTSIMNCKRHHEMVDQHKITPEYQTESGANGPMTFRLNEAPWTIYEER